MNSKFQFFASFSESHVPAFDDHVFGEPSWYYGRIYDLNWRDYFLFSKLTVSFRIGIISYLLQNKHITVTKQTKINTSHKVPEQYVYMCM